MTEIQENKELKESLSKCRCCQRLLIDDRRAVEIDDVIREQFFNLCQIPLLKTETLANRICQLCASDLQTFSILRQDLIEKQNSLYTLAGLEVSQFEGQDTIAIMVDEVEEEKNEKYQYEILEEEVCEEYQGEDYWEETLDEDDEIEELKQNSLNNEENVEEEQGSSSKMFLKIEKVQGNRKRSRNEMELNLIDYDGNLIDTFENKKNASVLDDEQTQCALCGIEVLQSQFDYHIELMHIPDVKCDKCDEMFNSRILLKKHDLECHPPGNSKGQKTRKKLFFCGLCDKEYDYKKYLDDHIRSFHKKERNRKCPICNRLFYHRDIKKHIEHVHGEKNITCNICGKLYSCLENLKLHLRYHDEPKFICEFENCGKKFHQKILWQHHMLKHSSNKPIECSDCGNFFYTIRDLKRHTSRVHTKVIRKCFGCDVEFHRKDKYREHVIKHHKELTNEERDVMLNNIRNLKWNEV